MSPCDEADEGSGSDSSTHSGHASLSRPESDDPYTASTLQGSEVSSSLRQVVVARHDLKRPKGRRRRESTKEVFQTAMALYDLTDVQPFYDQVADVKALLAWNRQRVVLAFRGTASMTNAWSDLQVGRPCRPPDGALLLVCICRWSPTAEPGPVQSAIFGDIALC